MNYRPQHKKIIHRPYNWTMLAPILVTKLYTPPLRPQSVLRQRLIDKLNAGSGRKLTVISAPAGFGKTTLVSAWLAGRDQPAAWLSLDEGDNDPTRFLGYLAAALQTVDETLGQATARALQTPQPPPISALMPLLLNDLAFHPQPFALVLDDYHSLDANPINEALTLLVEHLPPQLHLVIITREDPPLPLARLRARGQLSELRAADLRFTPEEASEFLNHFMGLALSPEHIAALEKRTEGWIAGLQLAALSMQGQADVERFIQTFNGTHHFVLDYLLEEVLHRQPEHIQTFLLHTSILNRLCGPLCEAVFEANDTSAQATLESLERANLFIVPLDNERRWYRYHHLFGELLRQRLGQTLGETAISELHIRASAWYEQNGLLVEAFQHATAAGDIERAEGLIDHPGMMLHFRSVASVILDWLASLPASVFQERPWLLVRWCTLGLVAGQTSGLDERLQIAEQALQNFSNLPNLHDLLGQIACARATLALTRYDPETMITQARRALGYLPPENLTFVFTAHWALSRAYLFQGQRAIAAQACQDSLAICESFGGIFSTTLALATLGELQFLDNQLQQAAETCLRLLPMFGDHPLPTAGDICLRLAQIYYQWNDLANAQAYGQKSLELTHLYDKVIDRFILSEVFLAQLELAQGNPDAAQARLTRIEGSARLPHFLHRQADVAETRIAILLKQGQAAKAEKLAWQFDLPLSQVRVHLALGNPSAALARLEPLRQQAENRNWPDERLKIMVLQALAFQAGGANQQARQTLIEALALAEPGGFIRLFVDEGENMRSLLAKIRATLEPGQPASGYLDRLLSAFGPGVSRSPELLTPRELEILRLIAAGHSNQEIGQRLFLALDTVKGHNRRIFDKLQVQRRTEAIARARELGLV